MKIKQMIDRYIQRPSALYDKKGQEWEAQKIRNEFGAIRSALYHHHDEHDIVAIYADNGPRYLLTILACQSLGLCYIPLRENWPMARVRQIQELSGFRTLVTDALLQQWIEDEDSFEDGEFFVAPESNLYIMFTSGSTGEPKGVVIKRESYENFLFWLEENFFEIDSSDRLLNSTHFTFDVSLTEIGLLLTKNVHWYCSNLDNNALVLAKELSDYQITVSVTVPNNYNLVLSERIFPELDLSQLKSVLLAGSKLPEALHSKFQEMLPNVHLYNCYGPTEATIYCLFKKMNFSSTDIYRNNVSIGQALRGCEAGMINQNGDEGELVIGGVQVMSEYLNRPELTNEVIIELDGSRFYKTGDIVFQNDEGEFFVTGRADDTVKVAGQRVNLSDIDGYLLKLPYVKDAATIAISDDVRDTELIGYLCLEGEKTEKEIFADLVKILLKFQIPKKILFKDNLPKNNSGKICKKTLLADWTSKTKKKAA